MHERATNSTIYIRKWHVYPALRENYASIPQGSAVALTGAQVGTQVPTCSELQIGVGPWRDHVLNRSLEGSRAAAREWTTGAAGAQSKRL